MLNKYFISINSEELSLIYNSALIIPKDYLLLEKSKILLPGHDCLLEVYLTENEDKRLTEVMSCFYKYIGVLPISRISKLIFKDKEKGEHICSLIKMRTVFIPDRLIGGDSSLVTLAAKESPLNVEVTKEEKQEDRKSVG